MTTKSIPQQVYQGLGTSLGGHWATKFAHLIPDQLCCAVNWGGGVHFMFQRDWIENSRYPDSYLMDLVETRSRMLGAANDAEFAEGFRVLSLLDQGLLSKHCAPLLLVNGKDDRHCRLPIFIFSRTRKPQNRPLVSWRPYGLRSAYGAMIVTWVAERLNTAVRRPQ
jgi:esterase FrsA